MICYGSTHDSRSTNSRSTNSKPDGLTTRRVGHGDSGGMAVRLRSLHVVGFGRVDRSGWGPTSRSDHPVALAGANESPNAPALIALKALLCIASVTDSSTIRWSSPTRTNDAQPPSWRPPHSEFRAPQRAHAEPSTFKPRSTARDAHDRIAEASFASRAMASANSAMYSQTFAPSKSFHSTESHDHR